MSNDIVYGGLLGFETFLGNHLLDDIFAGAYYPKQEVNKICTRGGEDQC